MTIEDALGGDRETVTAGHQWASAGAIAIVAAVDELIFISADPEPSPGV
jgi:hypothetical protein